MNLVAISIAVVCLVITGGLLSIIRKLHKETKQLAENKFVLEEQLSKTLSAKKASEIKLGYIVEQFSPLFDSWKYDPINFKFLGKPIDGVQFEDDEIIFIEIKSGKSGLNQKQRRIKNLVDEGKVSFKIFRVNEDNSGYGK